MNSNMNTRDDESTGVCGSNDYHFSYKICMIGDSGVGKSSIQKAIGGTVTQDGSQDGQINSNNICQVKESVEDSVIYMKTKVLTIDEVIYRIQLWDTPGAERFRKITARLCAGSAGLMFVFDATNKSSLDSIEDWLRDYGSSVKTLPKILIGNKFDSPAEDIQVGDGQASQLAKKNGMKYFKTSANMPETCERPVYYLCNIIDASIPEPPDPAMILRKGISIGYKLSGAHNDAYRRALFENEHIPGGVESLMQ
eukprot:Nk52_evm15s578 gene=Nk52_evmTU15s578